MTDTCSACRFYRDGQCYGPPTESTYHESDDGMQISTAGVVWYYVAKDREACEDFEPLLVIP